MRRAFILPFVLFWGVVGCLGKGDIEDAVRNALEQATQERTLDLGYHLGRWIFGSSEVSTVTKFFRAVEGRREE